MCARNTNTMGICLLGNYHNTGYVPSDTAIESITKLAVWKLYKENLLNPFDSSLHPINNPVGQLGIIAGHRDGCDVGYTSCPGDQFYVMIDTLIKSKINTTLINCLNVGLETSKNNYLIYPNPFNNDYFYIQTKEIPLSILMYNELGQLQDISQELQNNTYRIHTDNLTKGIYYISLIFNNTTHYQKIIKD